MTLMKTRKPTVANSVGDGAASSGACGHPSAWPVLKRLPWHRRFLAKAIRGSEPGAQVLEPLHLTRILGPPPDVYLHSLQRKWKGVCRGRMRAESEQSEREALKRCTLVKEGCIRCEKSSNFEETCLSRKDRKHIQSSRVCVFTALLLIYTDTDYHI